MYVLCMCMYVYVCICVCVRVRLRECACVSLTARAKEPHDLGRNARVKKKVFKKVCWWCARSLEFLQFRFDRPVPDFVVFGCVVCFGCRVSE